jgi:ABC-2 type transport system ATP-binding protein
MEYAVFVRNLTKKFNDFIAVNNISFEVKKGEVYGFLGANGAGKTTTIKMLCGLLLPDSGEAKVAGFDIYKETENIRKNIGYMSQKFSLYTNLTVKENIKFFAGLYGIENKKAEQRSDKVINEVELNGYEKKLISELPGGIRQRAALACAIAHEPQILFLDEPTAGVDPILRLRFWEIINSLSYAGVTVFVTTHYMDEVEHCDRIALMNEGKIVKIGTIEEIKRQTFETGIFEVEPDDVIRAYKTLIQHAEKIGTISLHGGSLHIALEKDPDTYLNTIENLLKEAQVKIIKIKKIEPSMDDVFVKIIRG